MKLEVDVHEEMLGLMQQLCDALEASFEEVLMQILLEYHPQIMKNASPKKTVVYVNVEDNWRGWKNTLGIEQISIEDLSKALVQLNLKEESTS